MDVTCCPMKKNNLTEVQKRIWRMWKDKNRHSFGAETRAFHARLQMTITVLMVVGIIGNTLVCIVMARRRKSRVKIRTLSDTFILNLSLADLLFRLVYMITGLIIPASRTYVTGLECKAMLYSQYACAAVTFALLAGIAVDRYLHILYPLRCYALKVNHLKTVLLLWVYAAVVSLGFILVGKDGSYKRRFRIPHGLRKLNQTIPETYEIVLPSKWCVLGTGKYDLRPPFTAYFILGFALPLLIMILAYSKVLLHLRNRSQRNKLNYVILRSKRKALKMLVIVVVSFVVGWAPIMVLILLKSYGYHYRIGIYPVKPIVAALSHTSSILNPAIYAFGNAKFRKELCYLFKDCAAKKKICSSVKRKNVELILE